MTIEQRQQVKDYYQRYTDLQQQAKQAHLAKDATTLKKVNREISNMARFRQFIYRGWALEEAMYVIRKKLNRDDLIKHLQSSIDLIITEKEKHKFVFEFLRYVFNDDEDTKESIKANLTID